LSDVQVFGNPEIVKVVSDQEVFDCLDLYIAQEEADTCMILQALHADKSSIMSACLFSLTDRNFFQSGIFLPSMT
jgi:hypothetical protein